MNTNKCFFLSPVLLVSLIIVMVGGVLPSPASAVVVTPGEPEEILVESPPTARAGVDFSFRLTVVDAEGNPVEDYDEMERTIELSADGPGELQPARVNSEEFTDGRLTLSLQYDKSEEIRIKASEVDNVATGWSETISVASGPPEVFEVDTPDTARAGANFPVRIKILDRHGNRVKRYHEMTNGLSLRTTGQETPEPEFIPAMEISEGEVEFEIQYRVAEEVELIVEDEVREISKASEPISILPGLLAEFVVSVPETVAAGRQFRIAIEARDRFGNIIENYSEVGTGVELHSTGAGSIEPERLSPQEFEDGVVFTELVYDRAETFRILVEDRERAVEARSTRMRARAGELSDIEVRLPREAPAGEEFDVHLTAYDEFGNRIRRYSEVGDTLVIFSSDRPERDREIGPALFEDGRAQVVFSDTEARSTRLGVKTFDEEVAVESDRIRIVPAAPGEIMVETPETAKAGETFKVKLALYDSYGNRIEDPAHLAGEVLISPEDLTEVQDREISPARFIDGTYEAEFRSDKAERSRIFVEFYEYDLEEWSSPVEIRPADFHRVAVRTPGQSTAGETVRVSIQLLDRFGNPLQQVPEDIAPLTIESTGHGEVFPAQISADQLQAPAFVMDVQYFVAEVMSLQIQDRRERLLGSSAPVSVRPAELARLYLETPGEVKAGQSFPVRLIAEDLYGNTVEEIEELEEDIEIWGLPAEQKLARLTAADFSQGKVETSIEYKEAGELQLAARAGELENLSDRFYVSPAEPERVSVQAPERVVAGRAFSVELAIFDAYDNKIERLPPDFAGVRLRTSSRRQLAPSEALPELFENGEAQIYAIYSRTGEINIEADLLEREPEIPGVSRAYISRRPDSAELRLVFTGEATASVNEIEGSNQVDVSFRPARLATDPSVYSFNNWFVKRFEHRQIGQPPLPRALLRIYPREELQVDKSLRSNLAVLELNRVIRDEPTLNRVQELIEQQDYSAAADELDSYLEDNPDDPYATRLRHRLDRIKEVLGH